MKSQWEGEVIGGLIGKFDLRNSGENAKVTWIQSTAPELIVCETSCGRGQLIMDGQCHCSVQTTQ